MYFYNNALSLFMKADIDLEVDDIRVVLLTSGYTPNIDTDVYLSDINANEIVVSGYTANGQSLGTKAVNIDNTNNRATFTAANPVWTPVSFTGVRTAVLVKWTGNAATSPLIAYRSAGSDASSTNDDFTVEFTGGIALILSNPA